MICGCACLDPPVNRTAQDDILKRSGRRGLSGAPDGCDLVTLHVSFLARPIASPAVVETSRRLRIQQKGELTESLWILPQDSWMTDRDPIQSFLNASQQRFDGHSPRRARTRATLFRSTFQAVPRWEGESGRSPSKGLVLEPPQIQPSMQSSVRGSVRRPHGGRERCRST